MIPSTAFNIAAAGSSSSVGAADADESWLPVALVWSCLLLLPFGRLVEIPVLLMAGCGLYLLARRARELLAQPSCKLFTAVFLAFWLAILISLPDAVNAERTSIVALNHLRFYFSGLFVLHSLRSPLARSRLLTLAAWLLAFWLVDALVQALLGVDLLGREPWGRGLSALYGPDSSKFGNDFAVLCPMLWIYARRKWPAWLQLIVFVATLFVVVSAGSRAAWVSVLAAACVTGLCYSAQLRRLRPAYLAGAALLVLLLPLVAYQGSEFFQRRVEQSLRELTGQREALRSSLAHRLFIWKGAASMIRAHPINGVGARGFRYAFAQHAVPDDPFLALDPPITPTHSHQLLVEIASETGLVGIAGLLVATFLLGRAVRTASPQARRDMSPYGIGLAAAFFPFNTHFAIYSAHWSQIVWWLIAVFCAGYATTSKPRPMDSPGA